MLVHQRVLDLQGPVVQSHGQPALRRPYHGPITADWEIKQLHSPSGGKPNDRPSRSPPVGAILDHPKHWGGTLW